MVASAGFAKRKQSARPLGEGVLDLVGRAVHCKRSLSWVRVARRGTHSREVNSLQDAPKTLQDAPRCSQDALRCSQDAHELIFGNFLLIFKGFGMVLGRFWKHFFVDFSTYVRKYLFFKNIEKT